MGGALVVQPGKGGDEHVSVTPRPTSAANDHPQTHLRLNPSHLFNAAASV